MKPMRLFLTAHRDERGYLVESWNQDRDTSFVVDKFSFSKKGTVRGLHFQHPDGQDKYVVCAYGVISDVCVDVRVGSPSYKQVYCFTMRPGDALFVPSGYAHGFHAIEDAVVFYKCSTQRVAEHERCLRWNDPGLRVPWSVDEPILSEKDRNALTLSELRRQNHLPVFSEER